MAVPSPSARGVEKVGKKERPHAPERGAAAVLADFESRLLALPVNEAADESGDSQDEAEVESQREREQATRLDELDGANGIIEHEFELYFFFFAVELPLTNRQAATETPKSAGCTLNQDSSWYYWYFWYSR